MRKITNVVGTICLTILRSGIPFVGLLMGVSSSGCDGKQPSYLFAKGELVRLKINGQKGMVTFRSSKYGSERPPYEYNVRLNVEHIVTLPSGAVSRSVTTEIITAEEFEIEAFSK